MEIEILLTFCSPSSNFQDEKHNIRDELGIEWKIVYLRLLEIKIFKY